MYYTSFGNRLGQPNRVFLSFCGVGGKARDLHGVKQRPSRWRGNGSGQVGLIPAGQARRRHVAGDTRMARAGGAPAMSHVGLAAATGGG